MDSKTNEIKQIRIAILQRVCPNYRRALFKELSIHDRLEMKLFIGEDVPNSKVKNDKDLTGINLVRLQTRFINFFSRTLVFHKDLVSKLKAYNPDVILCEGESHFLGYVQAIYYRIVYNKRVALMHWCFISLPGESVNRLSFRNLIKKYFRNFFDAFVVYSKYSKDCLIELGQPSDKIFIATNVGDVKKHLLAADSIKESPCEARRKLNLPERFTVLYLGTLDENKHPDLILDIARKSNPELFNFLIIGSGPLINSLRIEAEQYGLNNVYIPGRVVENLPIYCRASDVLIIPGRGGIVISEAMTYGIPIVVHQADGTEYDLVENGVNGFRVINGDVETFKKALDFLLDNPDTKIQMGAEGKRLVQTRFTTKNMVESISKAAEFAIRVRTKRK